MRPNVDDLSRTSQETPMISQGTLSILFGCHSVIHSILVARAWTRLYGRRPALWQTVCIFLHDLGHLGLNYLDDYEAKKHHWRLGARTAALLFGRKGYELVAGHCSHSGYPPSQMYKADKYSWYLAPRWWLYRNTLVESKLRMGYSWQEAVRLFQAQVRHSIESGLFRSTHSMFLQRCQPPSDLPATHSRPDHATHQ